MTFELELDNYKRKDGTHNIQIRITENRRLRRVSTGFALLPHQWNPEKKQVRKSHPHAAQINAALKSKMLEIEQTQLSAQLRSTRISSGDMQKKLRGVSLTENFFEFADRRIARLKSPSTRKAQTSVVDKLETYCSKRALYFEDITYDFILDYQKYLRSLGNSTNTVHANMKTIKAIYNEALNAGMFRADNNPWRVVKLKKAISKRAKLNEEQILALDTMEGLSGNMLHARNFFMLAFFLQGMRASDLLQLRWTNIRNGRCEYRASKTEKTRSKKIVARAQEILEHYQPMKRGADDYIFPFLKKYKPKDYTEDRWREVLDAKISIVNNNLKKVAARLGLPSISTHVARHSFADIALRRSGGNLNAVSGALDHSSPSVTINYINAASKAENDDLVDVVFRVPEKE
ncbi:site-specific integrase [Rhabdobacter roseus]|uniref:Integrase n=1 Tax=Rhabdobacter roseus TaxID=1655419 RepID=A0A840TRR2_9BACT|nr:site-specific integrase [Rhabdobacter roseus]MBB5284407.1 integrase [Rhabdobacter roseus]